MSSTRRMRSRRSMAEESSAESVPEETAAASKPPVHSDMESVFAPPEIPDAQKGNQLSKVIQLVLCPIAVMSIWYTCEHLNGSLANLFALFFEKGIVGALVQDIWGPVFFGNAMGWKIVGIYGAVQLLFMKFLPGPIIEGPETLNHNVPVYKANGRFAYILTLILFVGLSDWGYFDLYRLSIVSENMGGILGCLNFFSMLFVAFLIFKGMYAPSDSDFLLRGSFIADYYWGVELYPKIFGLHVKQYTNSRFGMMSWPLIILSHAARQYELNDNVISDSMIVSVILQFIYVSVFFYYENAYFFTMDIQHDRAGFYLCWGCLVFVPCVYTSPAMYLVKHPNNLGPVLAGFFLLLGLACFWQKTNCNRQRYNVREAKGNCTVWGLPAKCIRAKYVSQLGEEKESLLLICGWWGIATHIHYVGEILGAFCWSWPALFENYLPYFYVSVLIALLCHRAKRDDIKCAAKYGEYWKVYRSHVPWKIIPYIY